MPQKPTIFVQIPSYRDSECIPTIKDIFEKATYPERIYVGICWQYDAEAGEEPLHFEERKDQVRILNLPAHQSKGAVWAKHQAQLLWHGEDYLLQIDSHTRLAGHWDEKMLAELKCCPSEKPVLSCPPHGYVAPDLVRKDNRPTFRKPKGFTDYGLVTFASDCFDAPLPEPVPAAFAVPRFVFSSAQVIKEVPTDPYLYMEEEEATLSARLWTHGWDIYSPGSILLYHLYNNDGKQRPLHWKDHKDWQALQAASRQRYRYIMGIDTPKAYGKIEDFAKYGLGKQRTLEAYSAFCGIDFLRKQADIHAEHCAFLHALRQYKSISSYWLEPPAHDFSAIASPAPSNVTSFIPSLTKPFDIMAEGVPPGILVIRNFLDVETCQAIKDYSDKTIGRKLEVVDNERSTKDKTVTKASDSRITEYVKIDGIADKLLPLFIHIHSQYLEPFYKVDFEWFERPQILRYTAGGKYGQHADSEHLDKATNTWVRSQDRDYSTLTYLNEDYGGGEIWFNNFDFKIKPTAGMLVAFPSDHRYLHTALPTTSGVRYVIVSWSAVLGTPRVKDRAPYAATFLKLGR